MTTEAVNERLLWLGRHGPVIRPTMDEANRALVTDGWAAVDGVMLTIYLTEAGVRRVAEIELEMAERGAMPAVLGCAG